MRPPILPYFGGEFMGIKPPTPITIAISNNGATNNYTNCVKFPAPDANFDGSYFWLRSSPSVLERYNAQNTLVWTLPVSTVATSILTGATGFIGLGMGSDNNYYLLAYNSATKGCRLFKLSSPATSATVTPIGSEFTVTTALDAVADCCTIFEQPDGNLQLRSCYNFRTKLVIDKATGALVSESQITQSGRVLLSTYQANGLLYETLDSTIQVSGFSMPYGYTYGCINIFRHGKLATIPISWLKDRSAGYSGITIRLWSDYVLIAECSNYQVMGCTGLDRTDFDRWLHDICDAMGL